MSPRGAAHAIVSIDHQGNVFETRKAMCDFWGISQTLFSQRINKGWSIERSLTEPVHRIKMTACVDHVGNRFGSIRAMCDYWGINYNNFNTRRRLGWSLKDILETPVHTNMQEVELFDAKSLVYV